MLKRKEIIIALTFFLLGFVGTYLYKEQQLDIRKRQTSEIINTCMTVTGINRKLYSNCKASVNEVLTCYANTSCDTAGSIIRFGKIIKENEQLEEDLNTAADDMIKKVDSIK